MTAESVLKKERYEITTCRSPRLPFVLKKEKKERERKKEKLTFLTVHAAALQKVARHVRTCFSNRSNKTKVGKEAYCVSNVADATK